MITVFLVLMSLISLSLLIGGKKKDDIPSTTNEVTNNIFASDLDRNFIMMPNKVESVLTEKTLVEDTLTEKETTITEPEKIEDTEIHEDESEEWVTLSTMWTICDSNFRCGAGFHYAALKILNKGTEVTVINYDENNKWTEIIFNKSHGYIYTSLLADTYVRPYDYYKIKEGCGDEYLDPDLQEYAQDILEDWGLLDFYPYFICQAYQESRFNMSSVGKKHGGYHDWGIMQIWEGHEHDKWSPMYSVVHEYSDYKTNPYSNIYCGLVQWKQWYDLCGDYVTALGCYYTGTLTPSQTYIKNVMSHWNNLFEQ